MSDLPRINSNHVYMFDAEFRTALESIKITCERALLQGPLSRRNALIEIEDQARRVVAPRDPPGA